MLTIFFLLAEKQNSTPKSTPKKAAPKSTPKAAAVAEKLNDGVPSLFSGNKQPIFEKKAFLNTNFDLIE